MVYLIYGSAADKHTNFLITTCAFLVSSATTPETTATILCIAAALGLEKASVGPWYIAVPKSNKS